MCIRVFCPRDGTELVSGPELQKMYLLLKPMTGMQELVAPFKISWSIPKDKKPETPT